MSSKKLFFCGVCVIMSSEARRLTEERRITTKTYSKNKAHIICV